MNERRPRARALLRAPLTPILIALLGATAYLVVAPPSADLAAQEYRADLGLVLWNNGWYAGHHTVGYSVLFPPLGGLLGVRVAGALAAVAASALFVPFARAHWGNGGGVAAALWFAVAATAMLLTGRLTFLLGVAIAIGALLALQRERRAGALALAATTTLASPVAGLFVALAATAWALVHATAGSAGLGGRRSPPDRADCPQNFRPRALATRRAALGAGIVTCALAPIALTVALFPEGGDEPFAASAFWPALVATLLVAALLPARERVLRVAALLYALSLVAAFVIATPLGGNATRLGALAAGPIVLGALPGRRSPLLIAALAPALGYWALYPPLRDVARASGDPSTAAAYHAPLLRFLQSRPDQGGFRVEIPFTANHWEARHVAPAVALARGWERQLDRRRGALFYDGSLDAASYRAWLDEHAVAYVALPDVELDGAGRDEARLVRAGLPYLRAVWRDRHWRVFAVTDPAPLADGARAALGPTTITLRARRAGDVLVRVHHTRWWRVTAGRACVSAAPGDLTRVRVKAAGTVRLRARLTGSSCR